MRGGLDWMEVGTLSGHLFCDTQQIANGPHCVSAVCERIFFDLMAAKKDTYELGMEINGVI